MTMMRHVSDIGSSWVRVPVWALYFAIVLIPDAIASAILLGHPTLLFRRRTWAFMWTVFLVGINGTKGLKI